MLATRWSLLQFTSHPQSCRVLSTSVVVRQGTRPFTLPSTKLRALITLYHRSSSFITPENLSRRIDGAFTGTAGLTGSSGITFTVYKALQAQVQHNREKSRPQNLNFRSVPLNTFDSTTWSGMPRGERQALVTAALWGIQVGGKPSLETVQETRVANEELGNMLDQTVNPHKL